MRRCSRVSGCVMKPKRSLSTLAPKYISCNRSMEPTLYSIFGSYPGLGMRCQNPSVLSLEKG